MFLEILFSFLWFFFSLDEAQYVCLFATAKRPGLQPARFQQISTLSNKIRVQPARSCRLRMQGFCKDSFPIAVPLSCCNSTGSAMVRYLPPSVLSDWTATCTASPVCWRFINRLCSLASPQKLAHSSLPWCFHHVSSAFSVLGSCSAAEARVQHVTSCRPPHTALPLEVQGVWAGLCHQKLTVGAELHTGLRGTTSSMSCLDLGAPMSCWGTLLRKPFTDGDKWSPSMNYVSGPVPRVVWEYSDDSHIISRGAG